MYLLLAEAGAPPAPTVASLSLDTIRARGPEGVAADLRALPDRGRGAVVVANALAPRDMQV